MKKQIIGLISIGLTLLLTSTVWASEEKKGEEINAKPPIIVDEGQDLKPQPDRVKGVTFIDDGKSDEVTPLSLAKEKEIVIIKFEKTNRIPLTCKVMRGDKEIWSSTKSPKNLRKSSALEFEIEKSTLQVGDKIVISNRRNVVVRQILVGE